MDNYEKNFEQSRLIVKHLTGQLTDDEKEALAAWIGLSEHNKTLFNKITQEQFLASELNQFSSADKKDAWKRIARETGVSSGRTLGSVGLRYAAAAVVLIVGSVAAFFIYQKEKVNTGVTAIANTGASAEILPGKEKATLTLSDGTRIALDEVSDGEIAKQENISITKTADGQLVYSPAKNQPASRVAQLDLYNTIATPRGGQYKVVLPDGSKVWLNAASSLRYPTKFSNKERKVVLSGEAYFEVAKVHALQNGQKYSVPFRVLSGRQQVEVLGTSFNVNSYADEKKITTTLVEGSVKVISVAHLAKGKSDGAKAAEVLLKPGEQAELKADGGNAFNLVEEVNMAEIIAWKNGEFQFAEADVYTIMRQISRWYDVEVEFKGTPSDIKFRGRISRDVPISRLFQILQISGVNFKIEGRKIIVES